MSEVNLNQFIKSYWNYYIELEDQLHATKKYVDFDESNYKTFSVEYLKLLQATCSEIDVVGKIIAEYYDSTFKKVDNKNIQKWGMLIHNAFPEIESTKVSFLNDKEILPWKNWDYETFYDKNQRLRYRLKAGKDSPAWWTAYNKVKHERTSRYKEGKTNYSRANLENLILAMAALYIIEMWFIKILSSNASAGIVNQSKLFSFV